MMNIYLLIGLPGAGKSYWLDQKLGLIFDDISQMKNGMDILFQALQDESYKEIYIADVNFCDVRILKEAINKITKTTTMPFKITYVHFLADENTCLENVKFRDDGRYVIPTIKRFSKKINETHQIIKDSEPLENIIEISTPLAKNINKRKINI